MRFKKEWIVKEEIKKKLFEISDTKYKEFHSGLCPSTENIIGVRVPILRNYAKEIFNKYNWKQIIEEIDDEYYEEIMLKGMLIGLAKKEDINIILKYVENYVPKIDNWAICDVFCAGLKITNRYKEEVWNFIQKYLKSNKEFEIRFAVVMILDFFVEPKYLQNNFEIFNNIKNDGYYAKMAVAWAISVCLIKFYDETIKYLEASKLDNWTYNKAIQKAIESYRISNEKKEYLRKIKR